MRRAARRRYAPLLDHGSRSNRIRSAPMAFRALRHGSGVARSVVDDGHVKVPQRLEQGAE